MQEHSTLTKTHPNPAVDPAPSGRWTLRDKAAQFVGCAEHSEAHQSRAMHLLYIRVWSVIYIKTISCQSPLLITQNPH